jgi:hypothetical protein
MKRALMALAAMVLLSLPALAHAQFYGDDDTEWGPPPYNDVDNGQLLQIFSYTLAPFGYALEWGVTRPLYHLATQTPLAPVLSGDTDVRYFGETSNAALLPPNTFAPFKMPANPNAMEPDTGTQGPTAPARMVAPYPGVKPIPVPAPNAGYGGQSALH